MSLIIDQWPGGASSIWDDRNRIGHGATLLDALIDAELTLRTKRDRVAAMLTEERARPPADTPEPAR